MFNDQMFCTDTEAERRAAQHNLFHPAEPGPLLLDAPEGACRWPCEDILRCCGAEATHGSYCADHARRAYRRHHNGEHGGAGNDAFSAAIKRHNVPSVVVLKMPRMEDLL